MARKTKEQRQAYKGTPPRAWVEVRLCSRDRAFRDVKLLVDTGNPCAVIIGSTVLDQFKYEDGASLATNFGLLVAGWVQVEIRGVSLTVDVLGFASDAVVRAAQASWPRFAGLAGLPLLRLARFGGDADEFWIRAP